MCRAYSNAQDSPAPTTVLGPQMSIALEWVALMACGHWGGFRAGLLLGIALTARVRGLQGMQAACWSQEAKQGKGEPRGADSQRSQGLGSSAAPPGGPTGAGEGRSGPGRGY